MFYWNPHIYNAFPKIETQVAPLFFSLGLVASWHRGIVASSTRRVVGHERKVNARHASVEYLLG